MRDRVIQCYNCTGMFCWCRYLQQCLDHTPDKRRLLGELWEPPDKNSEIDDTVTAGIDDALTGRQLTADEIQQILQSVQVSH